MISRLSENTASRNLVGFNSQVANFEASRTLTIDDLGKILLITGAFTVTLPTDAEANFAIGDRVDILQTAPAGNVVSIAGNASTTPAVLAESNKYKLNGQYAAATLIKTAANTWVLIGNITS